MTSVERRFDPDTDREEHDHLKQCDEGIDGVPSERAWLRPTRDRAIKTTLHHTIELDMFPHDQADRDREDRGAARDVAENRLTHAPDWIRNGSACDWGDEQREQDPEPVKAGHVLLLSANRRLDALDRKRLSGWHRTSDFCVKRGIDRHHGHAAHNPRARTRHEQHGPGSLDIRIGLLRRCVWFERWRWGEQFRKRPRDTLISLGRG